MNLKGLVSPMIYIVCAVCAHKHTHRLSFIPFPSLAPSLFPYYNHIQIYIHTQYEFVSLQQLLMLLLLLCGCVFIFLFLWFYFFHPSSFPGSLLCSSESNYTVLILSYIHIIHIWLLHFTYSNAKVPCSTVELLSQSLNCIKLALDYATAWNDVFESNLMCIRTQNHPILSTRSKNKDAYVLILSNCFTKLKLK